MFHCLYLYFLFFLVFNLYLFFWCEQCHSFHNSIFFFYKYEIQDFFFMIKTAPLTNIKKCNQITSHLKMEIGNGWIKMLVSPLVHTHRRTHTHAHTYPGSKLCNFKKEDRTRFIRKYHVSTFHEIIRWKGKLFCFTEVNSQ